MRAGGRSAVPWAWGRAPLLLVVVLPVAIAALARVADLGGPVALGLVVGGCWLVALTGGIRLVLWTARRVGLTGRTLRPGPLHVSVALLSAGVLGLALL